MSFTEVNYENAVIECLQGLGYRHIYGPSVSRDYTSVLYVDELRSSLPLVNPSLPMAALQEAESKVASVDGGSPVHKNARFLDYLQNGIPVNYYEDGEERSAHVQLIDYERVNRNSFIVANQWTIIGKSEKRPDIVIFINGLPLVVFELKSPSREETDASEAYRQLRNYMQEIPDLFIYNTFLVMSDFATSKVGTITSDEDWFMEWKTKDGTFENTEHASFDTLLEGMLDTSRLLDIIKNFICFSHDTKILSGYHQYYAVRKAVESAVAAAHAHGKGGVFWHTQGSGKSLSMVFFAQLLQQEMNSPTLVVLTDRNDLDDQLYGQFAKCAPFLHQTPQQATSRANLKELLAGREAHGIIFSTMQKFEESSDSLSDRRNIVVIADEAHRGQYGLEERVNPDTGEIRYGAARLVRDSLPHATYIGFTGTPISAKDRSTIEVFGNYIDIYDMTQSVKDGATRPVYYESRVVHLKLDEDVLRAIDNEYDILADNAEPYAIDKSKKELGRLDSILGAEQTIFALCQDIVDHYEKNRESELTGKAMIVAYSRPIAMKIYRTLLHLRPAWEEKLGVVMTSTNNDPEDWRPVIGNKRFRDDMAVKFKNDESPFKIAIVVDMWLTGFDVPSLATMYVYKPMVGHSLMQAIARVNRVYKGKEGGLVVDYVGIASALKRAMRDYTHRDQSNYGDTDISTTALPKFVEKLEVCRSLFHGFDYSIFLADTSGNLERATVIKEGTNFLAGADKSSNKELFIKEAKLLRKALSLCRSLLTNEQRMEAAYFEAVCTVLTRITSPTKPLSVREINGHINELLRSSIHTDGVINLFSDVDLGFSIFDQAFLEEISRMKERNLSVEILKSLLAEQVALYKRTNLVKSEKFSEMLSRAMRAYLNGMLSNEEVIAQLMAIAHEISNGESEAESLGLTPEEKAFYDAITQPEAVKDFYNNQELVAMTQELTEMLRSSRTIDWQKKESARAAMRRLVKKLLKKYQYPPEGLEYAIATVLGQCEMWADN